MRDQTKASIFTRTASSASGEPQSRRFGRHALWLPLVAFALACPTIATSAEDAASLPLRKAGLWQLKTTMDAAGRPHEQTFKLCIDDAMEKQTAQASDMDHKENCSRYEVKRENDTTTMEAECIFNSATVQSHTEMSGDFQSSFHIKINSTTLPPAKGEQSSIPIKRVIDQDGSYLGADCAGLQPGEAMGEDGNKVMVQ